MSHAMAARARPALRAAATAAIQTSAARTASQRYSSLSIGNVDGRWGREQPAKQKQVQVSRPSVHAPEQELAPSRHHDKERLQTDFFDAQKYNSTSGSDNGQRSAKELVRAFRKAVQNADGEQVATHYSDLRIAYISMKQQQQALTSQDGAALNSITIEDLRGAMQAVLGGHLTRKQRRFRDVSLARLLFSDMLDVFAFQPEAVDCHHSLFAESVSKDGKATWRRLLAHAAYLQTRVPSWQVTSEDWLLIAIAGTRAAYGSPKMRMWWRIGTMRKVWKEALQSNMVEKRSDFRNLVACRLLRYGAVDCALDVIRHGVSDNVKAWPMPANDVASLGTLLDYLCRLGLNRTDEATKTARALKSQLQIVSLGDTRSSWRALLLYEASLYGGARALRLAGDAIANGLMRADDLAFDLLVRCHERELNRLAINGTDEHAVELLKQIEEGIGIAPCKTAYAICINALVGEIQPVLPPKAGLPSRESLQGSLPWEEKALNIGKAFLRQIASTSVNKLPQLSPMQVHEAILLYRRCRSQGILPSKIALVPLLKACTSSIVPSMDTASQIFEDYRLATVSRISQEKGKLDASVYLVMLAGYIRTRDAEAMTRTVEQMLRDEIIVTQDTRTDIVLSMLQATFTAPDVYRVYKILLDASKSSAANPAFTEATWLAIVHEFIKLHRRVAAVDGSETLREEDGVSASSFDMILGVVDDAQKNGVGMKPSLYTMFLDFCGKGHSQARAAGASYSQLEPYRSGVVNLHRILQQNMQLVPDLRLITSLMNAYNHVQLPQFALEIWHRLVMGDAQVDAGALAVILDTCGRAALLQDAQKAWTWARRSERVQASSAGDTAETAWPINKDAWDAYLECLARCGEAREAIRLATTQMAADLAAHQHRIVTKRAKRAETVLGPDAKTFGMLLRYCAPDDSAINATPETWHKLRATIERDHPHVWPYIKDVQTQSGYIS